MDARTEAMIRDHMSLAQSLAQQQWAKAPHALELDELRGIAYLGLVGAAVRWRPYCAEKNYSPEAMQFFKPFVVQTVRGRLIDAIRSSDWAGRNLRTRAKALQEAGGEAGASYAELAERTGMTVAQVRSTVRGMAQRSVSVEGEELELGSSEDVESSVVTRYILDQVIDIIRNLDPEQQIVIALRYHRGLQLQHVAHEMGITESRASQLHAQAILAVHARMRTAAGGTAA